MPKGIMTAKHYTLRLVFEERQGTGQDEWFEFVKNVEFDASSLAEFSETYESAIGHIKAALKYGGRVFKGASGELRTWDRVHVIAKAHLADGYRVMLENSILPR